ncbi:MAG TPA: AAA family ATPase [Longimicrobiales bacterium]
MVHDPGSARFIGRTSELEVLSNLLTRARAGVGGAAVIGGDAGVGKSRLCRQVKSVAVAAQMRVIEGRCSPAEATIPFAPFIDALRFRLARGEGAAAADVLQPILAHVAPLFQDLAQPDELAGRSADPTATPFDRILGVLRRLTSLGPVLFTVEDLHWSDPTSRDLIHYVVRRIASLPMVLLLTYRTDEVPAGHSLHRMATALARDPAVLRLHLEPLNEAEVAELLREHLHAVPAPDFAAAVAQRAEGNPLFIEELLGVLARAFPERAPHYTAADLAEVHPPVTITDMVQERLAPLSNDAHDALLVAAVIGRTFPFDLLTDVLEWPEERLLTAVEELVAHRFLTEIGDPGEEFSFRHGLVQEAMYTSVIARRRRVWHRRVAAVLEQRQTAGGLPHARLAHHYQLGGDGARARTHLLLSGDEAARLCAWQDAEVKYEQALNMAEQAEDRPTQAVILERLAEVAWWQNRVSAVEQYAGEALAISRSLGERGRAAALLRRLANLDAHQRGDFAKATTRLLESLSLVEDDAAKAAVILNDLGRLQLARGHWADAAASFERALTCTAARADCAEEALALVNLGRIAIAEGKVAVGVQRLELARALVHEEDMPIERAAEVFHAGIRVLDGAREHARAQEWVDAGLRFATKHRLRGDEAIYKAYGASIRRRAGDWQTALTQCAISVTELRKVGRAELREALRIQGDLYRVSGDLKAAHAAYDEAASLGEADARVGKALVLMAEHRWDAAANMLDAALAGAAGHNTLFAMRVLPILIEVHANRADADRAKAALHELASLTAQSDYRAGAAATSYSRALVYAAARDAESAAAAARDAWHGWRELELPYEAARAALLLARLTNDQQVAQDAARTFEILHARLDLAQAQSLLRQLGIRPRARRAAPQLPAPLDRLTSREAEVLIELSRGRTNKQIAKMLAMSPKTVGNHVANIFAKLGCTTRTEAAHLSGPLLG